MDKPKILVVDENEANRLLLCQLLKDYNVVEADSAEAALNKVEAEKPDLMLLDEMVPEEDGDSLLSTIKSSRKTQLIPVILITPLHSIDDKIKCLENGADDFIAKPLNPLELTARVKSLLRIKRLHDQLENFHNVVISLALALEAKDDYSVNHSKRTAEYAYRLARRVVPDEPEVELIKFAGLLHDIGKIGIRDEILTKPGKLTSEEYEIIKTHPVLSEKICSSISSLAPCLPFIRSHHESYNGKGYPDGLQGDEIPLGGRILAIADAFDALTSDRPYRKGLARQVALDILRKHAGEQWDPLLVQQFCEIIESEDVYEYIAI
ncbi:response regulator [Heliobacterium chlorum]|uniref:Stage 0 sporulation protein A homolog n=1 Tax=Heliobacterium chlorum TaxID=2698 RepID=A0ABR7T8B5_HELCL|nr:response regulator [Heliobacterium chlorum]